LSRDAAALQQHRPAVLAYLTRRVWDRDAAEDLCQETFLRALKAGGRLREVTRLRSYLLRIAHNLALDHLRRREPAELAAATEPDGLPDGTGADPATRFEAAELARRLGEVLVELPADQRTAFELGVLERLPYAEVARRQGWSVAKVKVNVYRARQHIMAVFGGSAARRGKRPSGGR
jgi:RNA polymerase sigma factor (sigma-70 family)